MVKVKYRGREFEFKPGVRVVDVFKKLSLNPEEHLAVVNGELRAEDEVLEDGEVLEIVRVVSGG